MKILTCVISVILVLGLVVVPSRADTGVDQDLMKKLTAVWFDCQRIKPGMTRAELAKLFKEDTGGVARPPSKPVPFQRHQRFDYRQCDLIKVEVDFSPSDSKETEPTDIIIRISRPYIDASPRV